MDLNNLIINTLEPLSIPVLYGWYDKNIKDTHITFYEYLENDEDYADDEATSTEHYIQLDIWSKGNTKELKKQVKLLLKEVGFRFQEGQDFFETDTEIYHIAMRFYIDENLD